MHYGPLAIAHDFRRSHFRGTQRYALLVVAWMREKWAGANSNRGYGHPKAEGYQATPPARTSCEGKRPVNPSVSTQSR